MIPIRTIPLMTVIPVRRQYQSLEERRVKQINVSTQGQINYNIISVTHSIGATFVAEELKPAPAQLDPFRTTTNGVAADLFCNCRQYQTVMTARHVSCISTVQLHYSINTSSNFPAEGTLLTCSLRKQGGLFSQRLCRMESHRRNLS